ncbi:MAG: hypothetical protein ACI84E_001106, partial [Planctomycetota bacterium]
MGRALVWLRGKMPMVVALPSFFDHRNSTQLKLQASGGIHSGLQQHW